MNKQEIKDLIRLFDKSGVTKVKIKDGDFSIELQKGLESSAVSMPAFQNTPAVPVVSEVAISTSSTATATDEAVASSDIPSIKSPMVGTFYMAPSPGSEPFVKVGSVVRKGQTIAIIEAMKIMNEIEAEFDCKITSLLVEDGEPVEFDMPLFGVEKL